ncbi:hypothetical protein [Pseudorhodoferax sp.]|uniref:hypothetical protein n=1 Tax=Pseudorhodoferax sp. TaxID=1993553 RepID=UPI0039E67A72
MRHIFKSAFAGTLVSACLMTTPDCDGQPANHLSEAFKGIAGIRVERNGALEANDPATQCVDVSLVHPDRNVGFVCRTSNKAFVADMGISSYGDPAPGSRPGRRPASGLVLGTPMAQYAMERFHAGKMEFAAADVDCDTGSRPLYRATATCRVIVSPLDRPVLIYGSFVLGVHTDARRGITHAQVREIWRHVAQHPATQ